MTDYHVIELRDRLLDKAVDAMSKKELKKLLLRAIEDAV